MSTLIDISSTVPNAHRRSANKYFSEIFSRLPSNTQKNYKCDIKHFFNFIDVNQLPGLTPELEETESTIKAYVTALCNAQLKYSTIKRKLATISKFLSIAKLPDPLKQSEFLRDFIKLELIEHEITDNPAQAEALTVEHLKIIKECPELTSLVDIRDKAIINVMFDALLRADEVVAVQLKHIDWQKKRLFIPKAKNDQTGKGSYRYLSAISLTFITDYIEEANIDPKTGQEKALDNPTRINKGILFRPCSPKGTSMLPYDESQTRVKDMAKLDYTTILRAVKRLMVKTGIDSDLSAHSPRVGGASGLAENGASLQQIQRAGDWKSLEMPARYIKKADLDNAMETFADKHNRNKN